MSQPRWAEGDPLTAVRRAATPAGLFTYSAVTWNPHRIHLDREYTQSLGHPDLLVPGALLADWMLQAVISNVGDDLKIRRYTYRALSPAFVGQQLDVGGQIARVAESGAGLEVSTWVRRDGQAVMEGMVLAGP